jgi:hypothetical protein
MINSKILIGYITTNKYHYTPSMGYITIIVDIQHKDKNIKNTCIKDILQILKK